MPVVDLEQEWARIQWMPDRRPIHEWASDNVTLPPTLTFSGKFDPTISRQFIAPFESLQNDRVREVNVLASPRSGKSLIADVYAPHALARDPGPVLWVFFSDDQARLHCETRLWPILHSCDPVKALLPTDRHKDRTTEIQLANGFPVHVKGCAVGNLQARSYRAVICDEVWQWPQGRIVEAKTRVGDYRKTDSSKFLCISQGGVKSGEWWAQYTAGVIHEWTVPCDACGVYQTPVWSGKHEDGRRFGLVYDCDKDETGAPKIDQAKATARYVCKHCGHEHRNRQQTQARWNALGRYERSEGGDEEVHSYHWNNLVAGQWAQMVEAWLKARVQARSGNWDPMIAFFRKDLAEFADSNSVAEADNPMTRITMDADGWTEGEFRIMTIDTQMGHFWVMVRAWAKSGESRRMFWGKVETDQALEELRIKFNVPTKRTIIDSAWQSRTVYTFACNYGWTCFRGDDKRGWYHVEEVRGQTPKRVEKAWSRPWHGEPDPAHTKIPGRRATVISVSVPATADRLQGIRDRGLWVEPKVDPMTKEENEYVAQMGSMLKFKKKPQDPEKWHQTGPEPHAWDCARMQVAAAMMIGIA